MAALTTTSLSVDGGGVPLTLAAAAGGGDTFTNNGRTFFVVTNGGGSSITVTFDSTRASDYGTDVDPAETVAAGVTRMFGPFHTARYGTSVGVTYSGVTTVTVGAFDLGSSTSLSA